jgi:hypothetical protein
MDIFEEQNPNCVDYCTFDGAANVRKAGEVLAAHYPRIVCTHGAEHVISLFFQDCFRTQVLNVFVKLYRKTYAVFGSGAMHSPYALFQKYSKKHNNGRNIKYWVSMSGRDKNGGTSNCTATSLTVEDPLEETLESPEFIKLKVMFNFQLQKLNVTLLFN